MKTVLGLLSTTLWKSPAQADGEKQTNEINKYKGLGVQKPRDPKVIWKDMIYSQLGEIFRGAKLRALVPRREYVGLKKV